MYILHTFRYWYENNMIWYMSFNPSKSLSLYVLTEYFSLVIRCSPDTVPPGWSSWTFTDPKHLLAVIPRITNILPTSKMCFFSPVCAVQTTTTHPETPEACLWTTITIIHRTYDTKHLCSFKRVCAESHRDSQKCGLYNEESNVS